MKKFEDSVEAVVKNESIWSLWKDVENWNIWDKDIEFSKINGEFKKNTDGILKPKNAPEVKFIIIKEDYLKNFTTRSFLPLCKMDFIHVMEYTKTEKIKIKHSIIFSGPLSFLFSRIIGSKLKKTLLKNIEELVKIAQKNN